jgi:flavin-binding protein dodecin
VVADLPFTRDELAARATAMLVGKGWADAVEGGFDMADDCLEVASWFDVGTEVEPEFDYDTGEWQWFTVDDDDGDIEIFDVIESP